MFVIIRLPCGIFFRRGVLISQPRRTYDAWLISVLRTLGTAEQAEQTAAVLTRLGDTITTFLITEQANPDAG